MKPVYRTIIFLAIFSIAMGFMESAVVVYLRTLYYPGGFAFPLVPLDNVVLVTELLREAATLIMLISIAVIAGKNVAQKFVFFLFCFAIWDIFYYIFLKLLIDWPSSVFTWDILFLLPVPWVGPVLAPCLLSFTMILLTFMVIYLQEKQYTVSFLLTDWVLMITGSLVIIGSFTIDYFRIFAATSGVLSSYAMTENLRQFVPVSFNWFMFFSGWIVILADIVIILLKSRRYQKQD